jgi:sterol desaturase/sphingolipid hydroxylase (fatty acid hydroxylase superfamily)
MAVYLLHAPLLGSVMATMVETVSAWTPARAVVARLPFVGQVAMVVLIAELVAYWVHRLQHTVPVLWRVHSVHHSSDTLRWWSAFRFHPLDTVVARGVPLLAVALCGSTPPVVATYLVIVVVVTVFAHADIGVPAPGLSRIVVVPAFHRSHHERGRESTNFALVLPLCDVAFGTASFAVGARTFGSSGEVARQGVVNQLAWGIGLRSPRRARRDQRTIAQPRANEAMLAQPLIVSATAAGVARSASKAASPIATDTSVIVRAATPPAR